MKLIVSIILSLLAAAVANPTERDTRSCGLPCEPCLPGFICASSGQEGQCSNLGYSCPAVGAPVLGGGGSSSSACEADCSCVEICP
ncbi:hypothetical protein B0H17DRAFT_1077310 [Mycena rosella]|uniref:Uncharacterized protein n=1 Tax=Mycena rosella TaxID=1033263 RepID=A0AAD7D757_MYCRO|nr:hypothetical protein B0H17DRAFT_1077310 [Mycena rosella]